MKSALLALALPILLTGCAGTGYYGYDDGPYYGPAYYYGGPMVNVGFYGSDRGGYYQHSYHHYDSGYSHSSVTYHGSSHSGGRSVASVSRSSGHSGGSHRASVSSGATHIH